MQKIVDENRKRAQNMKTFYSVFKKSNPFFIGVLYPRTKDGNHIYVRKLPLEPHVNFSIDCYANHQDSFLFSSSFKEIYDPL
jgi:hypothetical protein